MNWAQLYVSLNILRHCSSLGLKWKLTQVLWPLMSFPNFLIYWVWHFNNIIFFRIWSSSAGIPSPQLAFLLVMLPKAHLTPTPGCLALDVVIQLRLFLFLIVLCILPPLLNIFCCYQTPFISFLYPAQPWIKCSLGTSSFLEVISSLSHSIIFLYFFSLFI